MLPLDLVLAKCAMFWTLNTFSPSFCFLSEPALEVVNYSAGTVYVALLNTVCVCEVEEEGAL